MADYVEPGGAFEAVFAELVESGFVIPWISKDTTPPPKESKPSSKTKFTCPGCASNAWGKPELRIYCSDCNVPMIPKTATQEEAAEMLKAAGVDAKTIALMLGLSLPPEADAAQIDVEGYIAAQEAAGDPQDAAAA